MIVPNVGAVVERADDAAIISEIPSRYSVSKRLGSGGHGVVFKAFDSSLAKEVAIKMLLTSGDPKLLGRFQREAKLASNLNHPNIVTVFDFGVTSGDKPYMVLEYIEGWTIEQLLTRNGPYTREAALPIFLQIAEGISYAHARNILHRDLKTSNVLVRSEGAEKKVKIVDFGLAKTVDEFDEKTLTKAGSVLGSPYFMSPEQAQAKAINHRSDIYSFGCIMYKMLTGKPPIAGESALETMALKSSQPAPKLDSRVVPETLKEILDRCLRIDPGERYDSMDELIEALNEFGAEELQRKAIQPEPTGSTEIVPCQKSRSKVIAIGFLAAITAAALLVHNLEKPRTQQNLPPTRAPELKETTDEKLRTADREIMDTDGNGVATSPTQAEAYKLCGVALGDTDAVIAFKMENYLKKKPGFNWIIYKQLRMKYVATDQPRKALETCDEIFKNLVEDLDTLNSMTGCQVNDNHGKTIRNLHDLMNSAPDLKYLKVACTLMLGDTELKLNHIPIARVYYKKVFDSKEPGLDEYRKIAASKLKQTKVVSH